MHCSHFRSGAAVRWCSRAGYGCYSGCAAAPPRYAQAYQAEPAGRLGCLALQGVPCAATRRGFKLANGTLAASDLALQATNLVFEASHQLLACACASAAFKRACSSLLSSRWLLAASCLLAVLSAFTELQLFVGLTGPSPRTAGLLLRSRKLGLKRCGLGLERESLPWSPTSAWFWAFSSPVALELGTEVFVLGS